MNRIITLTDRPPVQIAERDWPQIARSAGMTADDGSSRYGELRARRHADGRAIVYGRRIDDVNGALRHRGGELVPAGGDIAAACRRVGETLRLPGAVIRECIARLPAEVLS
jgi:hypothetical protein